MSEKKTKLFRIRKTVCKMLNARGYLVAQAELDRDKDSFTEEFGEDPRRDALTLQFDLREDPTQHIFVFFPDEEKVGVKTSPNTVTPIIPKNTAVPSAWRSSAPAPSARTTCRKAWPRSRI